jgi:hypothetical protein
VLALTCHAKLCVRPYVCCPAAMWFPGLEAGALMTGERSGTPSEHGFNFVANLFGGTGLWTSMTTESWRQ